MAESDSKHISWKWHRLDTLLSEHGTNSSGAEEVHSVSVKKGLINQIEHLGRSYAASNTDHYNLVKPGDIVYTKSPTGDFPLGVVKRSQIDYDAIVSPLYGVFTPVNDEVGILIDELFSDPSFSLRYLTPLVFKGAKNTINVTNAQFLSGLVPVPERPADLTKVVKFIQLSRVEITLLSDQLTATKRRNEAIMQGFLRTPACSQETR